MRGSKKEIKGQEQPLPFWCPDELAWPYRWFSGRPMNGHRYTDATGFHYGTMATDISGRATAYQLLPGYKRFLVARVPVMTTPLAVVSWYRWPLATGLAMAMVAIVALAMAIRWHRVRRFRGQVVEPVAAGLSGVMRRGHEAGRGHTWVAIPRDFRDNPVAKISVRLPMDWLGEEGDRKRMVDIVATRLSLADLSAAWTWANGQHTLVLTQPPKPPKRVTFEAGLALLDGLRDDQLAMGVGARDHAVIFSLALESPHLLIAGGSGAGKSELLAWLVGQFMRRGFGVLCLDAKFTSHMWLRRIPGVAYAAEAEEMHEGLIWLDGEILKRARFVAMGGDPDTLVPLVALLEEMNGATNRLRAYWNSIKEAGAPMMSPALTALANIAAMGRELRIHILMAGQSVTAKASGGPEARENFGGRVLGRATSKQWNMLAPQIKPAPIRRQGPGRWHLVVGDVLQEFQVPFMDLKGQETPGAEARLIAWATGGEAVPDVPAMMATGDTDTAQTSENPRSEPVVSGVSLRDYALARQVKLDDLRNWRARCADFPAQAGTGPKNVGLYAWEELDAFVGQRLRDPVSIDKH